MRRKGRKCSVWGVIRMPIVQNGKDDKDLLILSRVIYMWIALKVLATDLAQHFTEDLRGMRIIYVLYGKSGVIFTFRLY